MTETKTESKAAKERKEHGPVNAVSLIGNITTDATHVPSPEEGRAERLRLRLAVNPGLFADGSEKPADFYNVEIIAVAPRDSDGNATGSAPTGLKDIADRLNKGQRVRVVGRAEHWGLQKDMLDGLRDKLGLSDANKLDDPTYRACHYATTPHIVAFWSGESVEPKRGTLRPLTLLPAIGEDNDRHDSQTGFVI